MTYSDNEMLKLLHDSKALSIWDRKKGPVFWYIAGVPGPFYVNTEMMIGADLAAGLLEKINGILAASKDPAARAAQLDKLILAACNETPAYREVIATMAAKAKKEFPSVSWVSGGERRDWLFSIPFARATGLKHVYLYKDKSLWAADALKPGETGFHIADLINNAASYFDFWLPALEQAKLKCAGTMCINTRGSAGVERLQKAGQKVVAFNSVDLGLFRQSLAGGLIDQATYDEIAAHFASPREWAVQYLMGDTSLFNVARCDKKSFERLKGFLAGDPWKLRGEYPAFFDELQSAVDERLKREAA